MSELTERQVLPIAELIDGGPLEDGTGIVINFRLQDGQVLPLQLDPDLGERTAAAILQMLTAAAGIRQRSGTIGGDAHPGGAPLHVASMRLLPARDGTAALLVPVTNEGPHRPIRAEPDLVRWLARALGNLDRDLARRRRRSAN